MNAHTLFLITALILLIIISSFVVYGIYHRQRFARAFHLRYRKPATYSNYRLSALFTALFIILITLLCIWGFYDVHSRVSNFRVKYSIYYLKPDSVLIKNGPSWFLYDPTLDSISITRSLNDSTKTLLMNLVEDSSEISNSYRMALNKLAYKAIYEKKESQIENYILLLYCITALLGCQLRTLNNFIGVTCYKKDLKMEIWWPWYALRPLMAFISGGVTYLIIAGGFFTKITIDYGLSSTIIAICFISGFGIEDFYGLLRQISKKILGPSEGKK